MECSDFLESNRDYIKHNLWGVYYVRKETLINDVCWKCEAIIDCNYLKTLEKIHAREKAEREKEIQRKQKERLKQKFR